MSDPRPEEIAIFAAAFELPEDAQAAFLEKACQGDRELQDRITGYLRSAGREGPLDASLPAIAVTLERSSFTQQVGGHIGPYKLIEKIGEGGMGQVYMARQREPVKRNVALKVIGRIKETNTGQCLTQLLLPSHGAPAVGQSGRSYAVVRQGN